MRRYSYSYTVRACRQRWRLPVPEREQFDEVVRCLSLRPAAGVCDRRFCVADVGGIGRVYYEVMEDTREMVITEYVRLPVPAAAS